MVESGMLSGLENMASGKRTSTRNWSQEMERAFNGIVSITRDPLNHLAMEGPSMVLSVLPEISLNHLAMEGPSMVLSVLPEISLNHLAMEGPSMVVSVLPEISLNHLAFPLARSAQSPSLPPPPTPVSDYHSLSL